MVEFAIGLAVMTLSLLGTITIAGYQEVQRRMAVAARQGTFEAAWTALPQDRASVLRRAVERHLDDPAMVDATGHRQFDPSEIAATASVQPAPGRAQAATRLMLEPLQAVGSFLGSSFDLSSSGLIAARIQVRIPSNPRLPEPFAGMFLELQQPFSLMSDAWNASGPVQVRQRTAGLVPTSALSGLQALWQPLLAPLALIEPSLARLCLGIIEADRIPEDRLSAGQSPLPGRCP